MTDCMLPNGSFLIELPEANDERGALTFATAGQEIPFPIQRVFWIHGIPAGARRGGHCHNTCSEVVVAVQGAFRMVVDDGRVRGSVWMDSPRRGILVPAGMWCELTDFEPGTVVMVMASHPYDASGYCHRYEEFLKKNNNNDCTLPFNQ